jgi:MoaA/NifB/PqqE/SkfB family radical SAM enzyme
LKIKMSEEVDFKSLGFPFREMYEFPNIINIEVYRGDCYCNCVHCPVGKTQPFKRKNIFGDRSIDLTLYKKIILEMTDHPHSTVRIHSAGEPLIWKDLVEALRFTFDHDIRSWIFTCAATHDQGLLEAVCDYAGIVEISINSITSEDYMATKGIDAFELVSDNIKKMHDYINRKNLGTRLIASRVESQDSITDSEFANFWKSSGLVNDAFVRSYHTYNDIIPVLSEEKPGKKHEPCLVHWARFNISIDGNAVICFNEVFKKQIDPDLIIGNIRHESIAEIWHSPKMLAIRKAELSGDYSEIAFEKSLPCKECNSCQPLFGNKQTSEYQIKQISE